MSKRNSIKRQDIFQLILELEEMEAHGHVFFQDQETYEILIRYFCLEHLIERAIDVADFGILRFGHLPDFYLKKAELLLKLNQAELALATLDLTNKHLLEVKLLRAEALEALGFQIEAASLLDSLKTGADAQELSRIYTQEALLCHKQKEYEREFFLLKAALKEDHNNQEALSRMMYCVETSRKHEESLDIHEKILEADPFCALAWFNLGMAHQFLCNHKEAIEAFEYAFLTNEDFEFAYRACADVCLYTNNHQKALQCYQEVLERFEPDEDLLLNIGLCHEKLGNFAIARSFFEKAVRLNPLSDEALYHIGHCYAGEKRWPKAIKSYQKAIRLDDHNEIYFSALGEAFYQTGNVKKAERYFRMAADIAADDPDYWIRLAQFLMDQQRFEDALEVLDEAEEYTYGSMILYYRSALLFKSGRKREAMQTLEEALCEDYYSHNSLFSLVPVLEKDSEVKAMISIFQPE